MLKTAPAPVSTAQPKTAAVSSGTSSGTFTSDRGETTVYSEKAETPRWWWSSAPGSVAERASTRDKARLAVGCLGVDAPHGIPASAVGAVAARGNVGADHAIADAHVGDTRADLLDHASGFVPENHGQRARAITVDDREVGVAQTGSR